MSVPAAEVGRAAVNSLLGSSRRPTMGRRRSTSPGVRLYASAMHSGSYGTAEHSGLSGRDARRVGARCVRRISHAVDGLSNGGWSAEGSPTPKRTLATAMTCRKRMAFICQMVGLGSQAGGRLPTVGSRSMAVDVATQRGPGVNCTSVPTVWITSYGVDTRKRRPGRRG